MLSYFCRTWFVMPLSCSGLSYTGMRADMASNDTSRQRHKTKVITPSFCHYTFLRNPRWLCFPGYVGFADLQSPGWKKSSRLQEKKQNYNIAARVFPLKQWGGSWNVGNWASLVLVLIRGSVKKTSTHLYGLVESF